MFILSRGLKDTCKTPQKSDEKLKHYWVKGFVRTSAIEPPSDNDNDISDEEPATTMVVPKRSVGLKKQPNKVADVITPKLPPKTKALAKTKAVSSTQQEVLRPNNLEMTQIARTNFLLERND